MLFKTPTSHFFSCGSSEGTTALNSFDGALLQANIGNTNLIRVSSMIPPRCRLFEPHTLPQGALVPAAYASITSEQPGEIISAAIAAAYPKDKKQAGLVMEYASQGSKEEIEAVACRMAEEGLMMRGLEVKNIRSIAVQHRVERIGTAFAAVVLWDLEEEEEEDFSTTLP